MTNADIAQLLSVNHQRDEFASVCGDVANRRPSSHSLGSWDA